MNVPTKMRPSSTVGAVTVRPGQRQRAGRAAGSGVDGRRGSACRSARTTAFRPAIVGEPFSESVAERLRPGALGGAVGADVDSHEPCAPVTTYTALRVRVVGGWLSTGFAGSKGSSSIVQSGPASEVVRPPAEQLGVLVVRDDELAAAGPVDDDGRAHEVEVERLVDRRPGGSRRRPSGRGQSETTLSPKPAASRETRRRCSAALESVAGDDEEALERACCTRFRPSPRSRRRRPGPPGRRPARDLPASAMSTEKTFGLERARRRSRSRWRRRRARARASALPRRAPSRDRRKAGPATPSARCPSRARARAVGRARRPRTASGRPRRSPACRSPRSRRAAGSRSRAARGRPASGRSRSRRRRRPGRPTSPRTASSGPPRAHPARRAPAKSPGPGAAGRTPVSAGATARRTRRPCDRGRRRRWSTRAGRRRRRR